MLEEPAPVETGVSQVLPDGSLEAVRSRPMRRWLRSSASCSSTSRRVSRASPWPAAVKRATDCAPMLGSRNWWHNSPIRSCMATVSVIIVPQIPELAEFPAPPGLKRHIDAVRTVAGASRANAPHPAGLYFVVGSESGWRKSSAFRAAMQGHTEADERADALFHENHASGEEAGEPRAKGFSPKALRKISR